MVKVYVDAFELRLLYVSDAAPAEVLDQFVLGLSAPTQI